MIHKTPAKVIFYRVKDNAAKIHVICAKAKESFQLERRLLISVPSFEAAQYIESLLWKVPEESFMPHVIADTATKEWIAITLQDQHNSNQSPRLLNLCPTFSPLSHQVEEVYELFDESHPQKLKASEQRMQEYRSNGFRVTQDY